jgi:hypothetical protein
MTRKDFENQLKTSGYTKRQENQYSKTGENPYHKIIVELDEPGKVKWYVTSISFSFFDIVVASYGDLDNWEKDHSKKSVEVLEEKGRQLIITYLNSYEFLHKMYKIAVKSDLQATRTGRSLYVSFEYSGKKYEIDYDSYNDYLIRKVTDKETGAEKIDKVEIKDLAESINGIEDVLNKAFNLPRTEIDLFKHLSEDEGEDSRL